MQNRAGNFLRGPFKLDLFRLTMLSHIAFLSYN